VRRRFLGSFYSNEELEVFLASAHLRKISVLLYYSILPGQNIASTRELIRHQAMLGKRFGAACQTMPIELEPGAPWALHPERYNVRLLRRSARDYYEHHRRMSCEDVPVKERLGFDDDDLVMSLKFFEAWQKKRAAVSI